MPSHDMFTMHGRGPRRRRDRGDRSAMQRTLSGVMLEMLPSVCDDRVLLAEVGASTGCIGWYVRQLFATESSPNGASAPAPLLRVIEEYGSGWDGDPYALALCARALVRLTADPEAHELATEITARWGRGRQVRPDWHDLPLVVPERAWISRREEDGGLAMLVTSWRDANDMEHSFAASCPDRDDLPGEIGDCPTELVLGESGEELVAMFEEPIDGIPGEHFEAITLEEAREVLTTAIDDVPLAGDVLLPGDLPLHLLAFLEHRRDLL